jgi:hypothetical protein
MILSEKAAEDMRCKTPGLFRFKKFKKINQILEKINPLFERLNEDR